MQTGRPLGLLGAKTLRKSRGSMLVFWALVSNVSLFLFFIILSDVVGIMGSLCRDFGGL